MIGVDEFSARLGLDPAAVRAALSAAHEDDHVWYVQLVLGIGAWITAIVGMLFFGILFEEVLLIGESGFAMATAGVILFGLASAFLARKERGEFTAQLGVAAASCGAGLGVVGLAIETESAALATLVAAAFAAASIWIGRSALLQFLLSALVIATIEFQILDRSEALLVDAVSLCLPAGIALLLWPPRRDLAPTASALVLTLPLTVIGVYYAQFAAGMEPLWLAHLTARIVCTVSLAGLIGLGLGLVAAGGAVRARVDQLAILVLAILAGIFLPPGLSATLAIMALGHTLGRRSLAIVGALLFAWFLWVFYAELHQTLLVKSIILMVAGAGLLVIRWLAGREPVEAAGAS